MAQWGVDPLAARGLAEYCRCPTGLCRISSRRAEAHWCIPGQTLTWPYPFPLSFIHCFCYSKMAYKELRIHVARSRHIIRLARSHSIHPAVLPRVVWNLNGDLCLHALRIQGADRLAISCETDRFSPCGRAESCTEGQGRPSTLDRGNARPQGGMRDAQPQGCHARTCAGAPRSSSTLQWHHPWVVGGCSSGTAGAGR
jgi:hypothetical protein